MSRITWGICLILAGLGLLGNFLGLFDFFVLFRGWWALLIIIPAAVDFFCRKNKTGSLVFISLGATLLLLQQHVISYSVFWKVLFSMIIIIVGIQMIFFRNIKFQTVLPKEVKTGADDAQEYTALFSGVNRVYNNEKFSGAVLSAVFGGVKLDLSKAIIESDVKISVNAVFGGCEITVPGNVNVKVSGSNIFGGVENKITNYDEKLPTIYLVSNVLFGGVNIK